MACRVEGRNNVNSDLRYERNYDRAYAREEGAFDEPM